MEQGVDVVVESGVRAESEAVKQLGPEVTDFQQTVELQAVKEDLPVEVKVVKEERVPEPIAEAAVADNSMDAQSVEETEIGTLQQFFH